MNETVIASLTEAQFALAALLANRAALSAIEAAAGERCAAPCEAEVASLVAATADRCVTPCASPRNCRVAIAKIGARCRLWPSATLVI
jgi:hypothetical protein